MGCPDSVLPEPLLKNHSVNCLLSNKDKEPYKDHLCFFSALAMYMNGHTDVDSQNFRYFTEFISKSGYDPKNFDIQECEYVRELARRSIGRFDKTVKLLRFNNHIIHTNDIDSFFKCFRCPSCETFFKISEFLNKHLLCCMGRLKNIYPKNYELRETLFEKLEGFNLSVSDDTKLFKNIAIFDFESI